MALKRFISTDLATQSWYSELEPKYKALWVHLILTCDSVGSFEITPKLFTAFVGAQITEADIFQRFGGRIVRWKDKGLIPSFVRHQYYSAKTSRLSTNCKPHNVILKRLAELGLTERKLDQLAERAEAESVQLELAVEQPQAQPAAEAEKPQRLVIPPKVEWVREYCASRHNGVDAQKFCDFYEGKGWKVGNQRMKDWQAAVRTWEGRDNGSTAAPRARVAQSFEQDSYSARGGF